MLGKDNALPEEQQSKPIEILNRRLADAIDLQLQNRQAYWNVKGSNNRKGKYHLLAPGGLWYHDVRPPPRSKRTKRA